MPSENEFKTSCVSSCSVYCISDLSLEQRFLSYYAAHEAFVKLIEPFTVSETP